MAIQKQNLPLPFAVGLDLKTDPLQLAATSMLALSNIVYNKDKQLAKRNGFSKLTDLPEGMNATTLTTHDGNLVAIGTSLQEYSTSSNLWINKGAFTPVALSVKPLYRSSLGQTAVDSAVAPNGLTCTVFRDSDTVYKYIISTGNVVSLPVTASQARVFVLGRFFIITYLVTITATPHLQYIAIPLIAIDSPLPAADLSAQVFSTTTGYDGYVANNTLYIAWNGSDLGGALRLSYLDSNLTQHVTTTFPGEVGDKISVTADVTAGTPVIWVSYYTTSTTTVSALAVNQILVPILPPTVVDAAAGTVPHITSVASNNTLVVFYEIATNYAHIAHPTNYIQWAAVSQSGTVGPLQVLTREAGLASKAFQLDTNYVLVAYPGAFQPTYFLMTYLGTVVAKLAYSNGGGYPTTQVLSGVSIAGNVASVGYLFKDTLTPVNRTQGVAAVNGIYSQTGPNLASFDLSSPNLSVAEIGGSLHIAGGFLWQYDGAQLVENGFHLWPEDIAITTSGAGGALSAQQYFYQVTYEWTDAAGNLHRSAPSVPYGIVTVGATSSNTLYIPTLRLTAKSSVRIVIYRWSQAQQTYYQVTSITSPLLNNPNAFEVSYVDTLADSAILGNQILYTTGGVIENIGPPACTKLCLYRSRLWLLDAEDTNLLWYSKQVIENTPVEMSDLFTEFVAPTTGVQGSTGPVTALSAMDDKLVVFKTNNLYYVTGNGPDNTGANNDLSDAIFITAVVGCSNQNSIVFIPQGLMFESDKGRWLLGRDLSTSYIGAPVEDFNGAVTTSATSIPGTNQTRMTLSNNLTLMYDYYFGRWGTFNSPPALSSTLYQGMHTYLDKYGRVLQESEGTYLDVANPVLISFTTSWFNLAGLQGFQRIYSFYLLGQYLTPHKLNVQVAYDYNSSPQQSITISPDNFAPAYGSGSAYGQDSPYGSLSLEQWRVFTSQQKCQAFQVTLQEMFDPSFDTTAGQGLTLSGLNLVLGIKKTYVPISAANSVG